MENATSQNVFNAIRARREEKAKIVNERRELNMKQDALRAEKLIAQKEINDLQKRAFEALISSRNFHPAFHHSFVTPTQNNRRYFRQDLTTIEREYLKAADEFNKAMSTILGAKINILSEYAKNPTQRRAIEFVVDAEKALDFQL